MAETDRVIRRREFVLRDVLEIAMGACMLILPLAFTEEAWDLGEQIPLLNALLFALVAYLIIAVFIYFQAYGGILEGHRNEFWRRVGSTYAITLVVAALTLAGIEKLPLMSDFLVALKRTILVSLPGCFFATAFDSLS